MEESELDDIGAFFIPLDTRLHPQQYLLDGASRFSGVRSHAVRSYRVCGLVEFLLNVTLCRHIPDLVGFCLEGLASKANHGDGTFVLPI